MNVLVTGGAGFVGSHLVEALVERGDAVAVVDDVSTGAWENLAAVEGAYHQVEASVLDEELVDSWVRRADAVMHLASVVGVRRVLSQPLRAVDVIVHGTRNVLDAAARHDIPVLITSSSEVYGKSSDIPFAEQTPSALGAGPRWVYGAAKLLDDLVLNAMVRERGLRGVSARLFNVVGPRQSGDYGMVLPRFVRAALRDEPLVVHGDGAQTRTFAHVADVVPALIGLLECEDALDGTVVNLGSCEPISIRDLADRVVARSAKNGRQCTSPVKHVDATSVLPAGFEEIEHRVPDVGQAEKLVGFECRHSLDDIIDDVIDYERGRVP